MQQTEKKQRRSIRLKNYSYSTAGFYYVTICTENKHCLFGHVINGRMHLNPAGQMVDNVWSNLSHKIDNIHLDEHIVMPNHLHGIVILPDIDSPKAQSLPKVIRRFKSYTDFSYRQGMKVSNWRAFDRSLWQRNYYEHVIRNDKSLLRIQEYIANNPLKWDFDRENPNGYMKD